MNLRDKRSYTLGQINDTLSRGKGSFRRDFSPQHGRSVLAAMKESKGGNFGWGSYGLR